MTRNVGPAADLDAAEGHRLTIEGGAMHAVLASGSGGDRRRRALQVDGQPYDMTRLIDEAARMSDRLDGLELCLTGNEELWLSISEVRGGLLEVRVDNVMMEARQGAAVL